MAEARVLCGSRDSLLATTRERVAGLDAVTVAVVLLFSAPLVACAVVGIVF